MSATQHITILSMFSTRDANEMSVGPMVVFFCVGKIMATCNVVFVQNRYFSYFVLVLRKLEHLLLFDTFTVL